MRYTELNLTRAGLSVVNGNAHYYRGDGGICACACGDIWNVWGVLGGGASPLASAVSALLSSETLRLWSLSAAFLIRPAFPSSCTMSGSSARRRRKSPLVAAPRSSLSCKGRGDSRARSRAELCSERGLSSTTFSAPPCSGTATGYGAVSSVRTLLTAPYPVAVPLQGGAEKVVELKPLSEHNSALLLARLSPRPLQLNELRGAATKGDFLRRLALDPLIVQLEGNAGRIKKAALRLQSLRVSELSKALTAEARGDAPPPRTPQTFQMSPQAQAQIPPSPR